MIVVFVVSVAVFLSYCQCLKKSVLDVCFGFVRKMNFASFLSHHKFGPFGCYVYSHGSGASRRLIEYIGPII